MAEQVLNTVYMISVKKKGTWEKGVVYMGEVSPDGTYVTFGSDIVTYTDELKELVRNGFKYNGKVLSQEDLEALFRDQNPGANLMDLLRRQEAQFASAAAAAGVAAAAAASPDAAAIYPAAAAAAAANPINIIAADLFQEEELDVANAMAEMAYGSRGGRKSKRRRPKRKSKRKSRR